ncbi:MAG: hypothetical protein QM811_08540 [Pirellulales bacterium]
MSGVSDSPTTPRKPETLMIGSAEGGSDMIARRFRRRVDDGPESSRASNTQARQ